MIDRNIRLIPCSGQGQRWFLTEQLTDCELFALNEKYGGLVNIKISKPTEPGTEQQNRAMHALMTEFYLTGMHSSPVVSIEEFKIWLKMQLGPCYDYEYQRHPVKVPKSWAKYSKQERIKFIDDLLSLIHQSGAYSESERIREIIEGMEKE